MWILCTLSLLAAPMPLRPQSPRLQHAIELATDGSATFRALLDTLASRAIVVIAAEPCDLGRVEACLVHQITIAAGYRFLRINVRDDVPYVRLAGLIAHELQHAVEVVQADVSSAEAMTAFYIDHGTGCPRQLLQTCYETEAAMATQARVLNELQGSGAVGSGRL